MKLIEKRQNSITLNKSRDLGDKGVLLKRARKKYFTNGIVLPLIDTNSDLKFSYWRSYHCSNIISSEDGKMKSSYCRYRWCMICNGIRTAISIGKYYKQVGGWDNKYFVTLTIPNVTAERLPVMMDLMLHSFRQISEVFRKRKIKMIGLRKLECTYNSERNDYHPHFHCIIKGSEIASMLKSEWLKRYPGAKDYCQDIRQADDKDVLELFKYFTKIVSGKNRSEIHISALDVIFRAIKSRRTFQNFGFRADKVDEELISDVEVAKVVEEIQTWIWENDLHDWINNASGELLTGYEPSEKLKRLLDGLIVTKAP